jgi:hypothetical protein
MGKITWVQNSALLEVKKNLSSISTVENFVTFLFCITAFTGIATQEYSYSYVRNLFLQK